SCDEFELTVDLPQGAWAKPGGVQIGIQWPDEAQDLDLFVYDEAGGLIAQSDGVFASTAESVILESAANGVYRVVVSPRFTEGLSYIGLAEVEHLPAVKPARRLLPNLISLEPRNFFFATGAYLVDPGVSASSCYPEEMIEDGARRCMRFDQIIANVGDGPFELRYRMDGLGTEQNLTQRIYHSDGKFTDRLADVYEFHAAHAHFHYANFAQSLLWRSNREGEKLGSKPVVEGKKNGFCMIDVENVGFGEKGDAARTYYFPRCNAPTETEGSNVYMVNGISVGWADVYNWFLADQYLEVSDVEDGYYLVETVTDPARTVVESNERDNVTSVLIQLCGDQVELVGSDDNCP
ncbi:MAG TPA: lysyl oxidase family protein, partial [Actinomycetota bacterium]|nr:lysyl oxidase family protein [Actinomycetota bacterium]